MPELINPRGQDNPSTYFVEDRSSNPEMIRIMIQDNMVTLGMDGPLSEQADPTLLRSVLDIGCGPGGWLLETAATYPQIPRLVGIDISWRMIEYARAEAQARKVSDRTEFLVMDALRRLEFPDHEFDLVNVRLVTSWMLVQNWPRFLGELVRVTRPGGIVRVTDAEPLMLSNSPAHMQLGRMVHKALYRAGHLRSLDSAGMTLALPQLILESGCENVQTRDYTLEYPAGTVAGKNFYENAMYGYQTLLPFLQKWDCVTGDYNALYEQAMIEMQQPDFHATWHLVTAWGTKRDPVSPNS